MLRHLSFSKKLILLLGMISVVIIAGIGLTSYWVMMRYIHQQIHENLTQITNSTYNLVETSVNTSIKTHLMGIAERGRLLVNFYYQQFQRDILTEQDAYDQMKAVLLDPEFGKIGETGYLAGVNGSGVLVIHPVSEGVDASEHEFMQRAITMRNGYLEYMWKNVGETQERSKAGALAYFEPWDLIVWASSYKSEFHALINLNDFEDSIHSITLGETGYAYVMDSRGNLIIHPTLAGQNVYDSQDSEGRYFIREICELKNGNLTYPWKNPEEELPREKLVYFKYFEELDWIIACGVYLDELYKPANFLFSNLFLVSLGILALVVLLSIFIGRSFSQPVKVLTQYAHSIGNGKLDIEIPVQSKDEFGALATTFNLMIDNLRSLIGQVQQSGIQMASSTMQLSATTRQQEAVVKTQVESTSNVIQSVREIADVTAKLVQTIQGVASSSKTPEDGSEDNSDLARMEMAMQQMEQASKTISNRLAAINEKAENITTVVTTITKVADQTNLLSLNAAIEAEKAGEYGRGFTVVAREIRRLADQTAVATLDIENMVKEMQSAVSSGVMEMDKFIAEVRHSAEDVKNISAKLTVIIKQVQGLSPRFEQVNASVSDLNDGMRQTSESLGETFLTIRQLDEAAEGLQEKVNQFKVS